MNLPKAYWLKTTTILGIHSSGLAGWIGSTGCFFVGLTWVIYEVMLIRQLDCGWVIRWPHTWHLVPAVRRLVWSVLFCSEDVQFYFMDTHSAPSVLKTVFQESRTLKVPVAYTQNAHNVTSAPFLLIQVCYKASPRSGEPDCLDGRSRGAILQMHVRTEMGGILVISFANNPLQTELTFLRPC